MLRGTLIEDVDELEGLCDAWDDLATENQLPAMAPQWVLAWFSTLAPPAALARIVAVHDGDRLVGIAPFCATIRKRRVEFRLPGRELAGRLAPLAAHGREWDVAKAITSVLSEVSPAPDLITLDWLPICSHWPTTLRRTWPGPIPPLGGWHSVHGALSISLAGHTLDSWLATRSRHFRERARRARRKFEDAGGTRRLATIETVDADIDTLMRLHASRWSTRKSDLAARSAEITAMLRAVARTLGVERFRLNLMEIGGEAVCAYLVTAAGGELLGLIGGWDERWARLSPFVVFALYLIEDAAARNELGIDLGPGTQSYKRHLTDADSPVGTAVLLPPSSRLPLTALEVTPLLARQMARRMLSDERRAEIRGLVRTAGRRSP